MTGPRIIDGVSGGLQRRRKRLRNGLVRWAMAAGLLAVATPLAAEPTIVFVGGKKQGMPAGEHDFPDGVFEPRGAADKERLLPSLMLRKATVKSLPRRFSQRIWPISSDASVVVLDLGHDQSDAAGRGITGREPAVQQEAGQADGARAWAWLLCTSPSPWKGEDGPRCRSTNGFGVVRVGSDRWRPRLRPSPSRRGRIRSFAA